MDRARHRCHPPGSGGTPHATTHSFSRNGNGSPGCMSAQYDEKYDNSAGPTPSRGVYWLPNLFTTGTLFGGFYAIVAAIDGNFSRAGIAIFVAMLFDGLDGRVARWTNTQSDFGKEYDSLCDMVAFGVAPAIVAYQWGIERIADY